MSEEVIFKENARKIYQNENYRPYEVITITKAVRPKFKPGDYVRIVDQGAHYMSYRAMAIALGVIEIDAPITDRLSKIISGYGRVHAVAKHESGDDNVYAVFEETGNFFLIGERGLRASEPPNHLKEELFEL